MTSIQSVSSRVLVGLCAVTAIAAAPMLGILVTSPSAFAAPAGAGVGGQQAATPTSARPARTLGGTNKSQLDRHFNTYGYHEGRIYPASNTTNPYANS
jgi:hypothetical protein